MVAKILDGRLLSTQIKTNLSEKIQARRKQGLSIPGLAVILVDGNSASATYVRNKEKACEQVGIQSFSYQLPNNTTQEELTSLIEQCNQDPTIHGILLQLPLPSHLDATPLLEKINPLKDIDGFHPYNLGRLLERQPILRPCTPYGIMKLLETTGESLAGKHAVVVGASNIVGRPMALELLLAKCTVTICHRFTSDLQKHVASADILIAAIGKPGVIDSQWIKPNAWIVDVGFTHLANGKVSGDIDFQSAEKKAAWITPVPGGVGPMTIAILLENTVLAAELRKQ